LTVDAGEGMAMVLNVSVPNPFNLSLSIEFNAFSETCLPDLGDHS